MQEIAAYQEELKKLRLRKNELIATVNTIKQQLEIMKQSASPKDDPFFA